MGHGVGISVVNALSEILYLNIKKDGKEYIQTYKYGKAINKLNCIGLCKSTGTKITFFPDKKIFNNIIFNYNIIYNRSLELSFLNSGIKIILLNKQEKNDVKESIFF